MAVIGRRFRSSSKFGVEAGNNVKKNAGETMMIQILFGDEGHRIRCNALAATMPGASIASASGPALDKHAQRIHTLSFWGHGEAHGFCQMSALEFVNKVKEWVKWNPTIKTLEIIACNSRFGTSDSRRLPDGTIERSWVKSFTDQVKPQLKKLGLTVKAMPMGMGAVGANRWSVLKFSQTSNTWLYVTAPGATDSDAMWPAVLAVEQTPAFQATKNYVTAGTAVKVRDTLRKYTMDFGTIGQLRSALITVA